MQYVREWTLAVCMACVMAGILQFLAPEKGKSSVIKLVLTLYILVTAFTPLTALRYPETRLDLPLAAAADVQQDTPDTQALAEEQARHALAVSIAQACASKGLSVHNVVVTLAVTQEEQASVFVEKVSLVSPDDAGQVQAAVYEALGATVPVEVTGEDG